MMIIIMKLLIKLKVIIEFTHNLIHITKEYVDILFKNKLKIKQNKIHLNPEVGLVNGL